MLPLQSIGSSCYFGGDALTCVLDQLVGSLGGTSLFGFLLGAFIFGVFYIASEGDLPTSTVALVLSGTVIVGMLPRQYQEIAYGVVLIGLGVAVWQVLQRYVLAGATQ
jgi:hypothetical protein